MSAYIPIGFYCVWCNAQRPNPAAVPELRGEWQRIANCYAPETCGVCKEWREAWREREGRTADPRDGKE